MGLDMYLYVSNYESKTKWNNNKVSIRDFYPKELYYLATKHYKYNFLSKETTYQIGYWRKANHIHSWFVHNCGNDIDECQKMYVSLEDLKKLLSACEKVKANHDLAPQLLPTQNGFFFGGTEYDEDYFYDIDYTISLLKRVINFLKKNDTYECYYRASW